MSEEMTDQETHIKLQFYSNNAKVELHRTTFLKVLNVTSGFLRFLKLLPVYIFWDFD